MLIGKKRTTIRNLNKKETRQFFYLYGLALNIWLELRIKQPDNNMCLFAIFRCPT